MNKYMRGILLGAGLAAAALYSNGCKSKDEPIVVRPRVTCCHNDCNSHSHDVRGNYVVKPAHNLAPKTNYVPGNTTRPSLSTHNPFEESGRARMPGAQRTQTSYPAQTPSQGASSSQRGSEQLMPNPYTGCDSGSAARTGTPNTDPCYDTSRTVEERARACAERLPTADEAFGPGEDTSLEQRLRECEELNRDLERQIGESMDPDRVPGRG
ncbi:MAG: hypothetical protein V1734_03420 [Nanoarchaeota archaeon]